MHIQDVANILNGIKYGEEDKVLTADLQKQLKDHGIVVVYGCSDDLVEFRGAIYDELGYGESAPITKTGLLENKCDHGCPYFKEMSKDVVSYVNALWCEEDNHAWTYETNIPHVTFNMYDDDEEHFVYCRGIIFSLSDVA
jgi:hypothetical protein